VDWPALFLSLELGAATILVLLPFGGWLARKLAFHRFAGRGFLEAVMALPLVLPPTVVGFYLLVAFGSHSWFGQAFESLFGHSLAFSFEGLVLASVLMNLPFTIQPIQRAFEAIPREVREAAACSGMPPWKVVIRIELPLAWPGIVTALVLTLAHTLGEFGVVLMIGGSIPGETKTIAIAIYDRVQAFDERGAGIMAAVLLVTALLALGVTNSLARRIGRRHG
jgi:molybdate transport system permease protein